MTASSSEQHPSEPNCDEIDRISMQKSHRTFNGAALRKKTMSYRSGPREHRTVSRKVFIHTGTQNNPKYSSKKTKAA